MLLVGSQLAPVLRETEYIWRNQKCNEVHPLTSNHFYIAVSNISVTYSDIDIVWLGDGEGVSTNDWHPQTSRNGLNFDA